MPEIQTRLGKVAARLAIRFPERVGGLVIVNSGGFTPWNVFARIFCVLWSKRWFARPLLGLLVWAYMAARSISPVAFARVIERAIPGSRVLLMKTGYVPFVSQPDEFLEGVEGFLRRC